MNEKTVSVSATSNWRASGCDLDHAIQTRMIHDEIFIKPDLDEILSEKYAVLLTRPANMHEDNACELQIAVCPRYKISSLTFVCSASKIELFFGALMEYIETIYGALISDDNDQPLSYRFDICVEKSGVVEISVKMPSAISGEICFFGILLQIAPNPNGVTTLLPGAINLDNVQEMLDSSNQRLSPGAEKCRLFMQMMNKGGASSQIARKTSNSLLEEMRKILHNKSHSQALEGVDEKTSDSPPTLDNIIKAHIDTTIAELSKAINKRLDLFENQQTEKLDRILKILENKNQYTET